MYKCADMPVFLCFIHIMCIGPPAGNTLAAVPAGLNVQMAMQRYMNCGRQSRSRVPIFNF